MTDFCLHRSDSGYDGALKCPYCQNSFSIEDYNYFNWWIEDNQECPHCERILTIRKSISVNYEIDVSSDLSSDD